MLARHLLSWLAGAAVAALAGMLAPPAFAQEQPTIWTPGGVPPASCAMRFSDPTGFQADWELTDRHPAVEGRKQYMDWQHFDCRTCTSLTRMLVQTMPAYGQPDDIDRLYAADAAERQKLVDEAMGPARGAICGARLIDARTIDGRKFAGIFSIVCGSPPHYRRNYFTGTPQCSQSIEVSWWGEETPDRATEAIIDRALGHVMFSP
jgi:hypothetical protein